MDYIVLCIYLLHANNSWGFGVQTVVYPFCWSGMDSISKLKWSNIVLFSCLHIFQCAVYMLSQFMVLFPNLNIEIFTVTERSAVLLYQVCLHLIGLPKRLCKLVGFCLGHKYIHVCPYVEYIPKAMVKYFITAAFYLTNLYPFISSWQFKE